MSGIETLGLERNCAMKSKYMMGLMFAFCFGVIGKTALDEMGYNVVAAAYAAVAGMDYYALRGDRDFRKAVEYLVESCGVYVEGEDGLIIC